MISIFCGIAVVSCFLSYNARGRIPLTKWVTATHLTGHLGADPIQYVGYKATHLSGVNRIYMTVFLKHDMLEILNLVP